MRRFRAVEWCRWCSSRVVPRDRWQGALTEPMRTVILDLDGPVLDGRHRHYACYERILRSRGYRPLDPLDYWERKRRRQDRRAMLEATGASRLYDDFLATWLATIETPEMLTLDRLQPGAVPKLREWRDAGVEIMLATQRHDRETLTDQLAQLDLASIFAAVVVCSHAEGGRGKAARVREAIGHTRVPCLWIGDTEVDIDAARSIGCPVWALSCGLRTEEYLRSLRPDFLSWGIESIDMRSEVS